MKFNQKFIGAGHEIATFAMSEERFWQEAYLRSLARDLTRSRLLADHHAAEADYALHQFRERKGIEE